jgi:hypothetical protein
MNQSRLFNLASVLFVFVLLITFTSTASHADDCDKALFYYYDALTSLMKYNQKAYGKIDGYLTEAKKKAKKYRVQQAEIKKLRSDGIISDEEKRIILKMEMKHDRLKEIYGNIGKRTTKVMNLSAEADRLGGIVNTQCAR